MPHVHLSMLAIGILKNSILYSGFSLRFKELEHFKEFCLVTCYLSNWQSFSLDKCNQLNKNARKSFSTILLTKIGKKKKKGKEIKHNNAEVPCFSDVVYKVKN